jgi:hypothetical protein
MPATRFGPGEVFAGLASRLAPQSDQSFNAWSPSANVCRLNHFEFHAAATA